MFFLRIIQKIITKSYFWSLFHQDIAVYQTLIAIVLQLVFDINMHIFIAFTGYCNGIAIFSRINCNGIAIVLC